jgi:hypothetical protein
MATVVKKRSWPVAVAAGGVLVAVVVLVAWRMIAGDAGAIDSDVEDGRSEQDASPGPARPDSDGASSESGGCDPARLAADLRGGRRADGDGDGAVGPTAFRLAAASATAVRGTLLSGSAVEGGSVIELDPASVTVAGVATSNEVNKIWVPTIDPAEGALDGDIVAYLSPDVSSPAAGDGDPVAAVEPAGIWVGCDGRGVAEPVGATVADRRPWPTQASLDDLWRIFTAASSPDEAALEPIADGDVAVFDVRLGGDERLRVSVPTAIAAPVVLVDEYPNGPTSLLGDTLSIEIDFAPCSQGTGTVNAQGVSITQEGSPRRDPDGALRICRRDQLLAMRIDAAELDVTDRLDDFDIRPIAVGDRYGPVLATAGSTRGACAECAPWGPRVQEDVGIVVNRTTPDTVAAVGLDDLVERWRFTTGSNALSLRPARGPILLDVDGGSLLALDPATGAKWWRLERRPDERGEGVAEQPDGGALAWSSFILEDDHRPAVLRWIDLDTGLVRWESSGRGGADWQPVEPLVIDGVAIAVDVLDSSAIAAGEPGSLLLAFDTADGRLLWTLDIGSRAGARSRHVLETVTTPAGTAVVGRTTDGAVFRVDPSSGTELWRTRLDAARFAGTETSDDGSVGLVVSTEFGAMLVDVDTGEVIER